MFTPRFVTGLVAALLTTASMVAIAPQASAAVPDLTYRGGFSAKNSDLYKFVNVLCPPGKKILGGSFDLVGAEGAVVLDDFIPFETATQSGLRVGAGEIVGPGESSNTSGTSADWQIFALAVCGTTPPGYSVHQQPSPFTVAVRQSVTAKCPETKHLLGGGASLANGFGQVSISGLGISSFGATATGMEDKDRYSGQWSVTAYAICADTALPGWFSAFQNGQIDSSATKTTTAFCPAALKVTGSGWEIGQQTSDQDSTDRYVIRTSLANSLPSNTVTAVSSHPGINRWLLTANVVCADGRIV